MRIDRLAGYDGHARRRLAPDLHAARPHDDRPGGQLAIAVDATGDHPAAGELGMGELDVEATRLAVADQAHGERVALGVGQDGHAISRLRRASEACGYSLVRARTRQVSEQRAARHARGRVVRHGERERAVRAGRDARGRELERRRGRRLDAHEIDRPDPRRGAHASADHLAGRGVLALEDQLDCGVSGSAHLRSIAPLRRSAKGRAGPARPNQF